ncbi:type III polyketide synthase [bacterium]|nr:type III polyketide synthase [bacterium]
MNNPRIISIGTAVPERSFTQQELSDLFNPSNPKIIKLFAQSHIKKRHLQLPVTEDHTIAEESPDDLLAKHRQGILSYGGEALSKALQEAGIAPEQLDYLICVTSTGYLCPGASALLTKQFGLRDNIHRLDVVGMGCNAAINAMQPLVQYLRFSPRSVGAMVCIENCSAAYIVNEEMGTAVVNSLFGDAAAAVVICGSEFEPIPATAGGYPAVADFESHIITDSMEAMRFDRVDNKLSFYLDRSIPYVLGNNVHFPVERLLKKNQLKKRQISWWVIHSGGKKVIDSIKVNLDLSDYDVRHTLSVLENYGNISSCSVLFSLHQLAYEGTVHPQDNGIIMAMGPGASIETALLRWV